MAESIDNNQEGIIKEAVQQFVDAQLRGEKLDIEEFVKQYTDLGHQIRESIQDMHKINNLFDSLVKADQSDFEDITDEHDLVGKKVGSFEIVKIIGRGGMGVVYLANDTKLKRSVAVKSIPAALADDSTARMRFKREAELLASLNHPNIAVIYEIVEQDKSGYLILEHIEGETLAERIARGPLKLEEALSIGKQVAEAISAAHKKGVIHRDLKPANIKVTPDGQVKVLDFGLAKATTVEGVSVEVTDTQAGHIIGTPAYMSPEQARGRPIDKRSDIWSFGCVLYEMLTGKVLFKGETTSDTLANILQTEPDFQPLPVSTPANIRVLLRRCLEKNPTHRLHDIADARIEIDETQSGTLESFSIPAEIDAAPRLFQRNVIIVVLVCLIAGLLIVGAILLNLLRLGPPGSPLVSRLSIPVPSDKPLKLGNLSNLAISPDGTRFVYVGSGADRTQQLYVRSLDKLDVKTIPGTIDARNPFFSPDGQRVGFFTPDLKIVSLTGGEPLTLLKDVPGSAFGSWAEDGTIVFSAFNGKLGLQRISDNGGKSEILIPPDHEESYIRYPQILLRGDAILYNRHFVHGGSRIEVFFPETGKQHTVLDKASWARYVDSGHLIFLRDYILMAVPFDIERFKITPPSVPLLDDIKLNWGGSTPRIVISQNGTIVYISGSKRSKYELVWVDRQGQPKSLAAPARPYIIARLSPDDQQIALSALPPKGSPAQVHLYDILRGTLIQLTTEGGGMPVWSPDGTQIAFGSKWSDGQGVFHKSVGSSAPPELLASEPTPGAFLRPESWSHDGKYLACTVEQDPNAGEDIWIIRLQDDCILQPLLYTKYEEFNPTFSPDGPWLAYVSDESGQNEVYLMQYPDKEDKFPVSSGGGRGPIWSRDGRELCYLNGNAMMAVQIGADSDSPVGIPEQLFELEGPYSMAGHQGRTYDISKDGRFLMHKRRSEDIEVQLICVQNGFEELKQLAPTTKKE
ncbi:protein kinase [Planctomycetota bacterium]